MVEVLEEPGRYASVRGGRGETRSGVFSKHFLQAQNDYFFN